MFKLGFYFSFSYLLLTPSLHTGKKRWKIFDFLVQCNVPENNNDGQEHKCTYDSESNVHLVGVHAYRKPRIPSKRIAVPKMFMEWEMMIDMIKITFSILFL